MSYVGGGHGEYVQETTYKYVGAGAGEFGMIAQKRTNFACLYLGGGVGLLVLVIIVVLLLMPTTTTTTPSTTVLPYDCNAGFANWQDGWSTAKKNWCCQQESKGCTTTEAPTTTRPTIPPVPPTPSLPYDCNAGVANWAAGWSAPKKVWCCAHGGQGCEVQAKVCILWGDPHIISFDQVGTDKNQALSFYGDGDFWLVKSSTVHIQGRFEGTKYTEGLAATNQIVVGGPFLHGHKIEVGTRDSGILTVDGQPVCGGFPSSYSGAGFSLTYDSVGEVPDVVPEGNEKRIVHMNLPLGVKVSVYQWDNYVDVKIEMSPQPSQDGVCGNANGNHADDTTQAIIQRVGARVRPSQNMLSGKAMIEFTPQMAKMMARECDAMKQASYQAHCSASLGVPAGELIVKSCTFDYCFGMNVRARSHAKTYA